MKGLRAKDALKTSLQTNKSEAARSKILPLPQFTDSSNMTCLPARHQWTVNGAGGEQDQ